VTKILAVGAKILFTAKNSTSKLSKHLASRHRNVKLIEKAPDPTTDMTAATTTSNSTGQTSDSPSSAKQVKIDIRATGVLKKETVSFDSSLNDGICRKNRIRLKGSG